MFFVKQKRDTLPRLNMVGLRTPRPRILFFYEKSIQKRIKEEVSSLISPQAKNLSESFEEWNNRSILGDNDTKLYFFTIYNIVSPPQSLRDVPPYLPRKFRVSLGCRKGTGAGSLPGLEQENLPTKLGRNQSIQF